MKKAALWLGAATVVTGVAMSRPAAAAEVFADVPRDHWAYQAVANLQERGIVIGYPDGTFGGKRAMTRYEFAVAVDRLIEWVRQTIDQSLAGIEQGGPGGLSEADVNRLIDERLRGLPTSEDLEAIRRLTTEFREELTSLRGDLTAVQRDLDALKARVGALEERVNRIQFSGEANLIGRGEVAEREFIPGFGLARRGVFDLDGRTDNNASDDFLRDLKTLYSLDLGIQARVSTGVTANALFNIGNYLPWVHSNRQNPGVSTIGGVSGDGRAVDVSTVPFIPSAQGPGAPGRNPLSSSTITQGNFGKESTNTSFSEFTPVKLYLSSPVSDIFFLRDIDATIGKFGVQFTPYTLRQVDPDSYTNVTLTDNGEIITTGAMARGRIGGLNLHGYAGTHYVGRGNDSSVNSGYPVFVSYGGPAVLAPMVYGALPLDQSAGVHGTLELGRFNIGGVYMEGGISGDIGQAGSPFSGFPFVNRANPNNDGRAMLPRRGQVFGGQVRFPLFSGLSVAGEFASSNILAGSQIGDREGVYPVNLRNAYDAKLTWGLGRLTAAAGYKQVDPFFGAPGSWGQIGRWKNPTNIQGFNASLGYNLGGVALKGSYEDYDLIRVDRRLSRSGAAVGGGVGNYVDPGDLSIAGVDVDPRVRNYTAGLSFNLTPSNAIDLGWQQARIRPWDVNGESKETYWTIGLGHTFNQNTLVKVMYQIVDYEDNGAGLYTIPGGSYKGGVGVTQLSVRF